MSTQHTEAWLAELQARFSAVLRAPLLAAGGSLRADVAGYPASSCADVLPSTQLTAADRLSVYQRQYWLRLLKLLQGQYPLTTRLLGAWFFNQHAIAFFTAHPPSAAHDLGLASVGFAAFLERTLGSDEIVSCPPRGPSLPRHALLEAARIDAAFARVFTAPEQASFHPTAADEAEMVTRRLRFSQAFAHIEEHWPLLETRALALSSNDEHALPLPVAHAHAQSWALYRTERGIARFPLGPLQARLLTLLDTHPIGHALALLEDECPEARRDTLPELTRELLARGVQLGFFCGFADHETETR